MATAIKRASLTGAGLAPPHPRLGSMTSQSIFSYPLAMSHPPATTGIIAQVRQKLQNYMGLG